MHNAAAQLQIGTLVVDKAPIDSIKFNFDYTATPDQAVEIPDVEGLGYITVKFNGSTIIPTTPGVYKVTVDHKNGAYYKDAKDFKVGTYTIKEDGTPVPPQNGEDDPVDIQTVTTAQDKVWTNGSQLFVEAQQNGFLQVYTISGQLVTTLRVNAGQKIEINLRTGIYVVVANGHKFKVVAK
jgi:hypothetical protein